MLLQKKVGPTVQAAPDTHFIKNDGRRCLSEWLKVAFVGTFNYASHLNIAVKTEEDGFSKPISLYFYSILPFFLLVTNHHPQGVGWFSNKQTLSCKIAGLPCLARDFAAQWVIFGNQLS